MKNTSDLLRGIFIVTQEEQPEKSLISLRDEKPPRVYHSVSPVVSFRDLLGQVAGKLGQPWLATRKSTTGSDYP